MRLNDDVLLDVLQKLPRGYLDRIPTANSIIRLGIERLSEPKITTIGPLRRVSMEVFEPTGTDVDVSLFASDPDLQNPDSSYRTWQPRQFWVLQDPERGDFTASRVRCLQWGQLRFAIRDCLVVNVAFEHVPPGMINAFAEFSPRWRNANLYGHPRQFDSLEHLTQFFAQLAATTRMLAVDLPQQAEFLLTPQHFWALEGVSRCEWLRIESVPQETLVSGAQLIEWLKIQHDAALVKRLDVNEAALAGSVADVVREIKSEFAGGTERCGFELKIYWRPPIPIPGGWFGTDGFDNDETGEELLITMREKCALIVRQPGLH